MSDRVPFDEVQACVNVLQKGGLILYPTDTIWGIGCDAANEEAVKKIFDIKKREAGKSLLILALDINMIDRYVQDLPDIAEELFEASDAPLTIILPDSRNLAEGLAADDNSIGIRIPDDPFCQEMLRRFRRPIVSTSANFSGEPSPSCFGDISQDLIDKMDHVANWRQEEGPGNPASSIIKINADGTFKVIR